MGHGRGASAAFELRCRSDAHSSGSSSPTSLALTPPHPAVPALAACPRSPHRSASVVGSRTIVYFTLYTIYGIGRHHGDENPDRRTEGTARHLRLESAYARTIGMLLGRVKAHGYKWRRWVLRNRFKQPLVKKVIPQKHQVKKLISMDLQGNGTICKRLLDEFQNVRRHTTYTR